MLLHFHLSFFPALLIFDQLVLVNCIHPEAVEHFLYFAHHNIPAQKEKNEGQIKATSDIISKFGKNEVFYIFALRGWDVLRLLRDRNQAARANQQNCHTIQLPREPLFQHDW